MASNDLYARWVAFCKAATPGTRYWLNDDLYDELWAVMSSNARYLGSDEGLRFCINYKTGYEGCGVTFYPKRFYPGPPRRAPQRYPGVREFYAR